MQRRTLAALAALALLPTLGHAQDRSRSGRARLELAFDAGYGPSSEDAFGVVAADLRLHTPDGLGAVIRSGLATQIFSNAVAIDLGVAYRLDLVAADHAGLQLGGAIGPSLAHGPFDRGDVVAAGGFAMLHLDFWYRNFLVGIGVAGHLLFSERHGQPASRWGDDAGREAPILALVPTLRIGGDWGL
ncbi:MAG: hypothetical protein KC619_17015 [Myxococcales bacterium]|nr:hypothetical protein [Myxococcales bacterium]